MAKCIFCKIIAGEIPAKVVWQDDQLIAFHDISPEAPVHILLIPKKHIANASAATKEDAPLLGAMMLASAHVAELAGVAGSGFRTVYNTGRDGGQSEAHLHMHILGGRRMTWPPG